MTFDEREDTDNVSQTLRIVGYYSKDGDLELEGDSQALVELANLLASEENSAEGRLFTAPRNFASYPYDGLLSAIRVDKNEAAVLLRLEADTLKITGSVKGLELLAEHIRWLAAQTSDTSNHIHIEHYPGHFFLSPLSNSLIITRTQS